MNWTLLANSLWVSALATAFAVVMGGLAALCALGAGSVWRGLLVGAGAMTLALPAFLVTNTWLALLGTAGVLRPWIPLNIFSIGGTAWILGLCAWPIAFFLILGAWSRLEPGLLESDTRLRGGRLLWELLLPMARPALRLAVCLVFVVAFNNFAIPAILQTKVFPAELWVSFNTTFDFTAALRLSWPLVVGPLLLLALLRQPDVAWPRLRGAASASLVRQQLGPAWMLGSRFAAVLLVLLSLLVPAVQLLGASHTWTQFAGAFAAGRSAWVNSMLLAAIPATLCAGLGLLVSNRRGAWLLWLPFLAPGIVLGLALVYAGNLPGLRTVSQSFAAVGFALVLRYAAAGWLATRQASNSIDPNLTSVARIFGAGPWDMLRQVVWPQVRGPVLAAWYITYLLCLWDVETLIFVIPPGGETLALRIFNLLHYGHNAQVNALCLILLLTAALPLALWAAARALPSRRAALSLLSAAALVGLSGCGQPPANEAVIQSEIFSHVQIIGERGTGAGQMNKPRSIALDREDNLYVVDMTGRVQKFSPEGRFILSWQMPQTDLGKPKGMCLDSEGHVVVVEPHYCRVNHFDTNGALVEQWGERGTNAGQLTLPRSIAVNSKGDAFVTEYTVVDRLQAFTKDRKQFLLIGRSGEGPGEFNRAEGVGLDADDHIYVADSCNHRIQVFARDGKFLSQFGHAGSKPGELSYPYDVRVDASGLRFVCEFGNSRIQIFDAANRSLEVLGRSGSEPGEFANPWAIALDSKGNLLVADSRNNRVQKFIRRKPLTPPPAPGVAAVEQRAEGITRSREAAKESHSERILVGVKTVPVDSNVRTIFAPEREILLAGTRPLRPVLDSTIRLQTPSGSHRPRSDARHSPLGRNHVIGEASKRGVGGGGRPHQAVLGALFFQPFGALIIVDRKHCRRPLLRDFAASREVSIASSWLCRGENTTGPRT